MLLCENCGAEIQSGSKFCAKCGQRQHTAPAVPESVKQNGSERTTGGNAGYYDNGRNDQYDQPFSGEPEKPPAVSVMGMLKRAFDVIRKKPIRLWGLSLLSLLLMILASIFGVLPIISIPVILVLNVGTAAVYLDGYRGKEVNSDLLFLGFKRFWRMAGGMAWMSLWVFIWALIPFAGIVIAVIKTYSYRFVPYILLTDPEVSATEALRVSMKMTKGYRGRMFGADILIIGAVFIVFLLMGLLSMIPFVGILFRVLLIAACMVVAAFLPLFTGLVGAAFYDEMEKAPGAE